MPMRGRCRGRVPRSLTLSSPYAPRCHLASSAGRDPLTFAVDSTTKLPGGSVAPDVFIAPVERTTSFCALSRAAATAYEAFALVSSAIYRDDGMAAAGAGMSASFLYFAWNELLISLYSTPICRGRV